MSLPSIEALTSRKLLQRVHGRLDEEPHESEFHAVFLLEPVLVTVAQIDHRLHVDFVERGQDRCRRLRGHQSLRDTLAQAGHRHPLLGAHRKRGRRWSRGLRHDGCRCLRLARRRLRRRDHVALRDPAAATGAFDSGRIHREVGHRLARGRQRCRRTRLRRFGRENGGRGRRRSSLPPVSPRRWTSRRCR